MVSPTQKKLEGDLLLQRNRISQHEENIKFLKDVMKIYDEEIDEMQVTLNKHSDRMVEEKDHRSLEETIDRILQYEKSAAALVCELTRHGNRAAQLSSMGFIGVVATLGYVVDDTNLSRLLSEYLGLDRMLALVCRTYDGVKTLETYDKQGFINRRAGLYGIAASMGRVLDEQFNVICLEKLIPYPGEFMTDDPQRRLDLPKPKLPNGETPPGFLGFAVNMVYIDSANLSFVTPDGHGLRETLFYSLFSQLQVYRTRTDMLQALPCMSGRSGAISLDGGIIRHCGSFTLGTRKEVEVNFPLCSVDLFLSEEYIDIQIQMRKLKWKKEKMMEDIEREQRLLSHANDNFEAKKQELLARITQMHQQ